MKALLTPLLSLTVAICSLAQESEADSIAEQQAQRLERERLAQAIADELEGRRSLGAYDDILSRRDEIRQQAYLDELARQQNRQPTAEEIAAEIRRQWRSDETLRERQELEAARRIQDELEQERMLQEWLEGAGLVRPKVLRWTEGGGTMERNGKVIKLPPRQRQIRPQGQIPAKGITYEHGLYSPASGWVWMNPLNYADLTVTPAEKPEAVKYQEGVKRSWEEVLAYVPDLLEDHEFLEFIPRARMDQRFESDFNSPDWPFRMMANWNSTR